MHPENLAAPCDQSGAGQLQDIAVFLEGAFQTDGTPLLLGTRAVLPFRARGENDAQPAGAFQAHGAVAFARRVRDADFLHAMPSAEPGSLFGRALDHAADAHAALLEARERLAQLREAFGIERSAKVTQPQDQRRALRPEG
jgi:hypothetical protein